MAQSADKCLRCSTCERMSPIGHRPMRSCSWTCMTWSTCVGTDTGGLWQWINTLTTRWVCRVPAARVKQLPRRCSNIGYVGQDPMTDWFAMESEDWELLELRCKLQQHIPFGRRHQVAGVHCHRRGCPRAESKNRELGIPQQHECLASKCSSTANLTEHGEVVFHSNAGDKRDQVARRSIIQASARGVLGRPVASETIKKIDTTQAKKRKRQYEDDIWDPRL